MSIRRGAVAIMVGFGLIVVMGGLLATRTRVRNREIALALLRIEQHVATGIPLPATDPAMVELLGGLSRWNVGTPHFNCDWGSAQVEYFYRLGPIEWTRADLLQRRNMASTDQVLHQIYTLIKPRLTWLGSQTFSTELLTLTNTDISPTRRAGTNP